MSGVTCGCMGFVEGDFYYSKRGGRPRSPAGTSCSSKGADATAERCTATAQRVAWIQAAGEYFALEETCSHTNGASRNFELAARSCTATPKLNAERPLAMQIARERLLTRVADSPADSRCFFRAVQFRSANSYLVRSDGTSLAQ